MGAMSMRWFAINRKLLPGILVDLDPWPERDFYSVHEALANGDVAVGRESANLFDNRAKQRSSATVIVLPKSRMADVFSWLNTYAPVAFPLSHYARVVSEEDWVVLQNVENKFGIGTYETNLYSSLIVGEMLGQGELTPELVGVPLSRVPGCFSFAVSRTALHYGELSEAVHLVIERLTKLENDRRFVGRSIAVNELLSIWSIGLNANDGVMLPAKSVALVLSAIGATLPTNRLRAQRPLSNLVLEHEGLLSDSAEERVRAFHEISRLVTTSDDLKKYAAPLIAGAAFVAGRGTILINLLTGHAKNSPLVMVWFGLYAGLSGPQFWDEAWTRLVRGVGKQLEAGANWSEPSLSDLSWDEFHWLASTFDGVRIFSEFPKSFSKTISIELFPGALCQLRLNDDRQDSRSTKQERPAVEIHVVENAVRIDSLLKQMEGLLGEARRVAATSIPRGDFYQPSFFRDDDQGLKRASRPKRAKNT